VYCILYLAKAHLIVKLYAHHSIIQSLEENQPSVFDVCWQRNGGEILTAEGLRGGNSLLIGVQIMLVKLQVINYNLPSRT
jgi:hypothetical protein